MSSCTQVEHHPDAAVPIYHLKVISVYYCKHFQHREYFKDNSTANYFQMVNVNIFKVFLHRLGIMDEGALSLRTEKCIDKQTFIWPHLPTDEPTDISRAGSFILFKYPGHQNF